MRISRDPLHRPQQNTELLRNALLGHPDCQQQTHVSSSPLPFPSCQEAAIAAPDRKKTVSRGAFGSAEPAIISGVGTADTGNYRTCKTTSPTLRRSLARTCICVKTARDAGQRQAIHWRNLQCHRREALAALPPEDLLPLQPPLQSRRSRPAPRVRVEPHTAHAMPSPRIG